MAKILIIEDSETQATIQSYLLWNAGHEVDIAYTGREALQKLEHCQYDVLLLDHELPDTSGLELFRVIRRKNPKEAVIMVTGKGNEKLAVQVLKEGARDYLVKSKQVLETLPHVVGQVLREDRIREELESKEKALKEAYANLEEKVRQRTAELESLNQRLISEIQERRKAEEALKKSQEIYRVLVDHAYEGIAILQNGQFLFINPRLIEILDSGYEEIVAGNFFDWIHPEDRAEVENRHTDRVRGQTVQNLYPFRILTRDRQVKWLMISVVSIVWEDEYAELCFFTDITKGKKAEEEKESLQKQLQQAQKMEAIGTLAGGIAHDFNNILGVIMGNAELAHIKMDKKNELRPNLAQIIKATDRAAALVSQILTFSRKTEQKLKPIDVRPIIKETIRFLRSSIPTTIDIKLSIHSQDSTIMADPTQIHQVVMNLCTNASQAMIKKGGRLTVVLDNQEIGNKPAEVPIGLIPGRYLVLRIKDDGHGMGAKTLERIFEPYFTTKEQGEGTGLGLAVVHGIVTNHHGVVKVESEPLKGSTFHIYFPLVESIGVAQAGKNMDPLPTGAEHILYVDDEWALVEMSRQILERLGYQVATAVSSQEAIATFKQHPQQFDLIITDQTMPNMTGLEMAEEMMKIRPDLPIILCTGFSQQVNAELAQNAGIKRFLMKPLNLRDMALAIRETLDETAPS